MIFELSWLNFGSQKLFVNFYFLFKKSKIIRNLKFKKIFSRHEEINIWVAKDKSTRKIIKLKHANKMSWRKTWFEANFKVEFQFDQN
jgi:hypothetical protein